MDAQTLLDPRLRLLDPAPVDIPPALEEGRAAIGEMGSILEAIPDTDLASPWAWSGEGRSEVRTGAYLALAALHEGAGEVVRAVGAASLRPGPAAGALTAASRARWDLHGVLETLDDETFDADPGHGEWSIRETLGHIVRAQRQYPWFSAWWMAWREGAARDADLPAAADDAHGEGLPTEADERSGSLAGVLARVDSLLDLGMALWSAADPETLAMPARWSGYPVTVGFRLLRWAAHMEEHTLQVDKTVAMLGRAPTETQRLHRLLCRAWGDVEAGVLALPPPAAERAASDAVAGAVIRAAAQGALTLVRQASSAVG